MKSVKKLIFARRALVAAATLLAAAAAQISAPQFATPLAPTAASAATISDTVRITIAIDDLQSSTADPVLGTVDIRLLPAAAPQNVTNFLKYVTGGSPNYKGTVFHRNVPGFVIQGGGQKIVYDSSGQPTLGDNGDYGTVNNEFLLRNIRGTIAMAKVAAATDDAGNLIAGTGADSATSEFFFNIGDNRSNLDTQNGGFTVFAEVIDSTLNAEFFGTTSVDRLYLLDYINSFTSEDTMPLYPVDTDGDGVADTGAYPLYISKIELVSRDNATNDRVHLWNNSTSEATWDFDALNWKIQGDTADSDGYYDETTGSDGLGVARPFPGYKVEALFQPPADFTQSVRVIEGIGVTDLRIEGEGNIIFSPTDAYTTVTITAAPLTYSYQSKNYTEGAGTLKKTGTGTATFKNVNLSLAGDAYVEQGTLIIENATLTTAGKFSTSSTGGLTLRGGAFVNAQNFENNGVISGTGTLFGNASLVNNSVISPGEGEWEYGTIRISSNFVNNGTIRLELGVDGTGADARDSLVNTGSGEIQIGGAVTLAVNSEWFTVNDTLTVPLAGFLTHDSTGSILFASSATFSSGNVRYGIKEYHAAAGTIEFERVIPPLSWVGGTGNPWDNAAHADGHSWIAEGDTNAGDYEAGAKVYFESPTTTSTISIPVLDHVVVSDMTVHSIVAGNVFEFYGAGKTNASIVASGSATGWTHKLIKTGNGSLWFSDITLDFPGGVDVNAGTFLLDGDNTGVSLTTDATINVAAGAEFALKNGALVTASVFANAGTLTGSGKITTTGTSGLANTGIISPVANDGTEFGRLELAGNLTNSGTIELDFSTTDARDVLVNSGTADIRIAGTVQINPGSALLSIGGVAPLSAFLENTGTGSIAFDSTASFVSGDRRYPIVNAASALAAGEVEFGHVQLTLHWQGDMSSGANVWDTAQQVWKATGTDGNADESDRLRQFENGDRVTFALPAGATPALTVAADGVSVSQFDIAGSGSITFAGGSINVATDANSPAGSTGKLVIALAADSTARFAGVSTLTLANGAEITGGTVIFDNTQVNVTAGEIVVGPAATLGVTAGGIRGTVRNDGYFSPGGRGSVGTATIDGAFYNNGSLVLDGDAEGHRDLLTAAAGTSISLTGTIRLDIDGGWLDANGQAVNLNDFVAGDVSFDNAVENIVSDNPNYKISGYDPATGVASFAKALPERASLAGFASLTAFQVTFAAEAVASLHNHLDFWRDARAAAKRPETVKIAEGKDDEAGYQEAVSVATLDPRPRNGTFWVTGFGNFIRNGAGYGNPAFDIDFGGAMLGADWSPVGDTLLLGVAVGGASGRALIRDGAGKVKAEQYALAAYATWQPFSGFYVEGTIHGGKAGFDSSRIDTESKIHYKGDTDGFAFGGSLYAGWRFGFGTAFSITPFAGLEFTHVESFGFNEKVDSNDDSRAELRVNWFDQETLRARAGVSLAWRADEVFTFKLRAAYAHDLFDRDVSITSRWSNSPDIGKYSGDFRSTWEHHAEVGPAIEIELAPEAVFSLGYSFSSDLGDECSHRASANVTLRF